MSNQTPYVTLCGYNSPSFGWVDFAGYLDAQDKFVVTHICSFKEGESTSKFGGDSVLPLDPAVNEIWTAYFTAAGIVYKPRNFKFPGVWEHDLMAMFPYETSGKIELLTDALRGKWQGGLVPTRFAALSVNQAEQLLRDMKAMKCVYRASKSEMRVDVIAQMGTLAVQAAGELPVAVALWKNKPQVKKQKETPQLPQLSPVQKMAKAIEEKRSGATATTETVVPRQTAQVQQAHKKGKKAETPAQPTKPPMKVVKSLDGGNPFQALS